VKRGHLSIVASIPLFVATVIWFLSWGGWGLVLGPLLVVMLKLLLDVTPTLSIGPLLWAPNVFE